MQDQDFKYRAKREAMVETLRVDYGISDERVLQAFLKVKRHLFVDTMFWDSAYEDSPFPIGSNQTISQPYTVAYMTSIITKHYQTGKILEIGTGSGFQAAILCELGYRVCTVERIDLLYQKAKRIFEQLRLRIALRYGDGTLGWSEMAPFDAIIVTAGAPSVPHSLLEQLNEDGRLIIPVGDTERQRMMIYHRQGDTIYETKTNTFAFVPLIGREGWNK
ncbi:protein-L-isoaspartate(D-aspartate) O-methyltransferase [Chloroherpeton thalassium]